MCKININPKIIANKNVSELRINHEINSDFIPSHKKTLNLTVYLFKYTYRNKKIK